METFNMKKNTPFAGINTLNPNPNIDSEKIPTKTVNSTILNITNENFSKDNKNEFIKVPNQTLIQSTLSAFNKQTKEIVLTVNMCIRLLPYFKILVIKGETSSGKYVVASEVFKRLDAVVEYFDLCELAKFTPRELSNQDLVDYLDRLLYRLNTRMNNFKKANKSTISDTTINDQLPLSQSRLKGHLEILNVVDLNEI